MSAPRASGADRKISFVAVSNLQIPGQNSRKSSKSENSHTYVYEPEDYADQHQLTVDALPSVEAYDRDGYRPTLDDILEGKSGVKQDQDVEEGEVKEGKGRIYVIHLQMIYQLKILSSIIDDCATRFKYSFSGYQIWLG